MMQGIINTWFLRYVIAAMSQEFDKGFSYLEMQISSNRGKIRFESLGIGCKPSNNARNKHCFQILINLMQHRGQT